jgi:hypothetical protein
MANPFSELLSQLLALLAEGQGEAFVQSNPILLDPRMLEAFESAVRRSKEERLGDAADSLALAAWFLREQQWAHEQDRAMAVLKAQSSARASNQDERAREAQDLVKGLMQCESAEQTLQTLGGNKSALLFEGLDETIVESVADLRRQTSMDDSERTAQRLLVGRDFVRFVLAQGFVAARMRVRRMLRLQISNLFIALMGDLTSRDRRAIIMAHAGVLATQECVSQFGAMLRVMQQGGSNRDLDAKAKAIRAFLPILRDVGLAAALQLPEAQWLLAEDGELRVKVIQHLVLRRAARKLRNASTHHERKLLLYAYRELLFDDAVALYYDEFAAELSQPAQADALMMLRFERELLYRCQEIGIEAAIAFVAGSEAVTAV